MNQTPSVPKVAPTSAPGVHEVATFLPGRLEFEHELDNEAADLAKDLEFGMVMEYGGERLPLDENDVDVKARIKLDEEKRKGKVRDSSVDSGVAATPLVNGHDGMNGHSDGVNKPGKLVKDEGQEVAEPDPNAEEPVLPPPYESRDSIQFKLTLLEMYDQRVEKRAENKLFMFDRGLLEHRKVRLSFIESPWKRFTQFCFRCWRMRRNGLKTRRRLLNDFGLLRSFRLLRITKRSSKV